MTAQSSTPTIGTSIDVYAATRRLLGGNAVIKSHIGSAAEAHQLIVRGLPNQALKSFVEHVGLPTQTLLDVLYVSTRSYARRRLSPRAHLPLNEGARLWELAELMAHASEVLGSQEGAEQSFTTPALALDGKKPIEMLTTPPGSKLVEELLTRMEYGVYT